MSAIEFELEDARPDVPARSREEAFRANLRRNLEEALGDRLHPDHLNLTAHELTAAYAKTRHGVDIRTVAPTLRGGSYVVFQAGATQSDLDGGGPLAARVLRRAPQGLLAPLTSGERAAIADCVERTEITRRHPFDWRPRARLGPWRFYMNVIAGPDRRRSAVVARPDRRAPANETLGLVVLASAATAVAALGLWLIGGLAADVVAVVSDPEQATTLLRILGL